jgi:hypothetical protein
MKFTSDYAPIEIQLRKSKLVFGTITSIIFLGIGIWLLAAPPVITLPVLRNQLIVSLVAGASCGFWGIMATIFFSKLKYRKPGLIISSEGITDNTSGLHIGFVPWSDITAVTERTVFNQKFINLAVNDPQTYIAKQPNALKRKAMEINQHSFGCAIYISTNGLDISYKELKALITDKFHSSQMNYNTPSFSPN